MRLRKDEPKVAILASFLGTIDRRLVLGEEMIRLLYGLTVQFPRLLGKGWVREAVDDDVD